MVTIKEVIQHVKEEKGAGSDRYDNLCAYFKDFSKKQLAYLEVECKLKIDKCRRPGYWDSIALTISIIALVISLITEKSDILGDVEYFTFAVYFMYISMILIIIFALKALNQIHDYIIGNKYLEILEIIHNVQNEKENEPLD